MTKDLEILWFRSVLHNQYLTGIFCIPDAVIQKIPDPPVRVFVYGKSLVSVKHFPVAYLGYPRGALGVSLGQ
jgi:hypothetical protein